MSRSIRLSILTLAIIALSAPRGFSQPAAAPSPVQAEVDAAIAKLKENKGDEAVNLLREASRRHPELAPPFVMLYIIFRDADPNKARQFLETAVTDTPADPEAFVIMGNIALNEHRLAEAELLFLKSQSLLSTFTGSPQRKKVLDPLTISGLAAVSEVRTAWPKAEQQLNILLGMEPKNAGVMQRMAKAMFFQRRAAEAYKMLQAAKAADPSVLNPEASLAILYEQFQDRPNATLWFDKALAHAPNDPATHRIVTRWALDIGDIKKAKEQADACLRIDSQSLENMLLRGVVALYEEDYAKAEEYFQLAHLQSPINFAATNNLALALCEEVDSKGNPDPSKLQRALEYAKQNYDANQRNPDACSTLGWILFKKKEYDQAALALRAAVQAAGGGLSFDTAYYLAMVQDARGQKEEAKKFVEQIIRSDKPFSKRKAAKELLAKLEKEVPATTPTSKAIP